MSGGEGALRFLERPAAIFFVGDSHVGMYDGLVLRDDANDRLLLCRSEYHRYLQAAHFTDNGAMLHEGVWRSLAAHHFLVPRAAGEGAPFVPRQATEQNGVAVAESLDIAPHAAGYPLVIVTGEIDSRNILGQLRPDSDIELTGEPAGFATLAAPPAGRTIPEEEFRAFLQRHFAPLERGLRGLYERGLRRLFLHDLPPPTPGDNDAARVLGFPRPARLRYKVVYAINRHYRELCSKIGIGFVDLWDAVTLDDVLAERFYVDGLHLNKEAALIAVDQVYRCMLAPAQPIP